MRGISLLFLGFLLCFKGVSQDLPEGLWNAGRAFSIQTSAPVKLQKQVSLVEIYPGFAVVKNIYDFRQDESDSLNVDFTWTDTSSTSDPKLGTIHNLPSSGMLVLAGTDTIKTEKTADGLKWSTNLLKQKITTITTYQICPTSQAKLSKNNGLKEHNGLIISNGSLTPIVRQVLIELKGDLKQIDLTGVYPSSVLGSRTRMIWANNATDSNLVIWYKGAAPDFKFDKKVVPQQSVLYDAINDFNTGVFSEERFERLDISDFSTNPKNQITSILYFVLFSIPWVMLVAFIIFLLKKPKKK